MDCISVFNLWETSILFPIVAAPNLHFHQECSKSAVVNNTVIHFWKVLKEQELWVLKPSHHEKKCVTTCGDGC